MEATRLATSTKTSATWQAGPGLGDKFNAERSFLEATVCPGPRVLAR
jgi:hypothetical protein